MKKRVRFNIESGVQGGRQFVSLFLPPTVSVSCSPPPGLFQTCLHIGLSYGRSVRCLVLRAGVRSSTRSADIRAQKSRPPSASLSGDDCYGEVVEAHGRLADGQARQANEAEDPRAGWSVGGVPVRREGWFGGRACQRGGAGSRTGGPERAIELSSRREGRWVRRTDGLAGRRNCLQDARLGSGGHIPLLVMECVGKHPDSHIL